MALSAVLKIIASFSILKFVKELMLRKYLLFQRFIAILYCILVEGFLIPFAFLMIQIFTIFNTIDLI